MSYRFVKIASYYRDFLQQQYDRNPELSAASYDTQHQYLMGQAFGWSDFYAQSLRKLGVEAFEIVSNAHHMQKAWADEHGVQGSLSEIVTAQLRHLKPDVVFFQDSIKLNEGWVRSLREQVPSIRLLIGFCCSPFSETNIQQFRDFDFMIVCSPQFSKILAARGLKVFQNYHAFEKSLLPRIAQDNPYPMVDFLFLG
jgi:spore maturation protein CgeB